MMSHIGRKAAIAAVAFATVGSTLFGGAALASGPDKDGKDGKKAIVTPLCTSQHEQTTRLAGILSSDNSQQQLCNAAGTVVF
jgi:hypothetical protein